MGGVNMTFDMACTFCYSHFKKEYDGGIGNIQDCGEYWIFYKKTEETEYGVLPIIVYKGDKQPIEMTFAISLKLSGDIDKATDVPVPAEYVY
jgi:hypothetical protein